jgi:hypothetical protein
MPLKLVPKPSSLVPWRRCSSEKHARTVRCAISPPRVLPVNKIERFRNQFTAKPNSSYWLLVDQFFDKSNTGDDADSFLNNIKICCGGSYVALDAINRLK